MAGNAFMVGDGLISDQRAIREVGSGDDNAAGALAVRRARDIVGCGCGLERGDGLDGDRRLWKKREKLRKFRFHLRDVAAEIVKDVLGGGRNVFGIGLERSPEGGKVSKSLLSC